MIVIPSLKEMVDEEIADAQVSINRNQTLQNVLTLQVKNGFRPFLAFVGQAWAADFDTFLTWRVRSNGSVIYRLRDSKVQLAPPEQLDKEITPWIELERQAILNFEVDVATGPVGATGLVTARFRVYYVPLKNDL